MRHLAALVLCLAIFAIGQSVPAAAKKMAFVIGIDRYDNLGASRQLKKAVNDARAVSAALRDLGYKTTVLENAGRLQLLQRWQTFLNSVEPGDIAVFYFSGHGVQIDGANYMLPSDVPRAEDGDQLVLQASSLSLNAFLDQMKVRQPRVSLNIIDACRDNPFHDSRGRTMGTSRGLARIDPATGTFVMFSAGTGQVALDALTSDDTDPNSVYTRSLLKYLKKPGLSLADIARDVRLDVVDLTKTVDHDQVPAYYDELVGRFCLAGCDAPPPPQADAGSIDADYRIAQLAGTKLAWDIFLAQHGKDESNFYVKLARDMLAKATQNNKQLAAIINPPKTPNSFKSNGKNCTALRLVNTTGETYCLNPGDSFRDCPDCPRMVVVPAGEFLMGSPPSEAPGRPDEGPRHKVVIAMAFAVGQFEVTRGEFAEFVNATGYAVKPGCEIYEDGEWFGRRKYSWQSPGFVQNDFDPVVCVSWNDATAFAGWASKKTGKSYRLLSESEWEYAARAGSPVRRYWGDDPGNTAACTYANAGDLAAKSRFNAWKGFFACNDGNVFTAKVGSYRPNLFNLHDMLGNVAEWVQDCYKDDYRSTPVDGSPEISPGCSMVVVRGGSWLDTPSDLRVARRIPVNSAARDFYTVGFRLARDIAQ